MEIEDSATLRALLDGGHSLHGARLQGIDLTECAPALLARSDLRGLVVLGGRASVDVVQHLVRAGAVVFPAVHDAPVDVYRSRLYTPEELYTGLADGYDRTPDALAYAWSQDGTLVGDPYVAVLRSLHDDSMEDALDELLEGRRVVGVMGGHGVGRGSADYADAARLGHDLAGLGLVVATGGGPGAMEAANLGAASPGREALETALAQLATVPGFVPSVSDWAGVALAARAGWPVAAAPTSIGIPTWFYGHEPPNVFAQAIAKFFSNALREDLLLARCTAGVVVLPGAAGTVQEVFQLATRLYYAAPGDTVPLVLVGRRCWTEELPVWPLLQALGVGREMGGRLHLVDDVADVADLLRETPRVVASTTRERS
ncbi:LOG family protein [Arsenicicoccus sp. oral taxon 190]|uniref:LOG family protein n=1 Tax=Arsenicicoccus sp. oral taxon 190 TaxID=1658671 RepID=UPI00067A2837|nr:LOG family protein [Arsenicicoccus sp. oral taxon 190]AKT52228.1 Rossmann fold nucleotide-binding protein [Arsenicicoccus sp. oral taxon 190]